MLYIKTLDDAAKTKVLFVTMKILIVNKELDHI